jgi:CBS domain containing-hemolysin-like protein
MAVYRFDAAERRDTVEPKNQASGISIVIGVVCIVLAAVGAASMRSILPRINGWQAVAYVIVAGVFIALIGVILNSILSFFRHD